MSFTRTEYHELFLEERDALFRFLHRLTRDTAEAEDLLQDTFLTVWRKRARFEGRGSPAGFLRSTAYRLFLNRRETAGRRASLAPRGPELERESPPPDTSVERRESLDFLAARVEEALASLPAEAREAFVLFRYEGLSCADIAALVDAPAKTVETRVRRATQLLAERLHAYRHHLPAS